jgi:hypothetical protein
MYVQYKRRELQNKGIRHSHLMRRMTAVGANGGLLCSRSLGLSHCKQRSLRNDACVLHPITRLEKNIQN